MKNKNEIIIGNVSTIMDSICLSLAGLIVGLLSAHGWNLPITETSLAGIIGLIIMFLFSIVNTKYKSTYFTDDDTLTVNVADLNENQINAIQNFVDNATKINNNKIEDIDPSLEYDDGGC